MILTNKLNLPQPCVHAATNDHEYTEGRYSVTELLGGTCEAILKRRHSDEERDELFRAGYWDEYAPPYGYDEVYWDVFSIFVSLGLFAAFVFMLNLC